MNKPKRPPKLLIGWRETVALPALGFAPFPAKIDTGARTTALHARNIETYEKDGAPWVSFVPDHLRLGSAQPCTLPLHNARAITNTSGIPEERLIVITELALGPRTHKIEISLSDRENMQFPMILGRTAMRVLRLNVNPARSWLLSERPTERTAP